MYNPEKLGRIARTNNFEALELMHESKKQANELNAKVRELIRRADELAPDEIREIGLELWELSDQLKLFTDEAVYWLFQNDKIFDEGSQRGEYKVKHG